METQSGTRGFGSVGAALEDLGLAARFLAGTAWGDEPAGVRAGAVLGMSQAGSVLTIAQGRAVRAFDVNGDHESGGYQSAAAWVRHVARSEDGRALLGWAKRTAAHPVLTQAVADGVLHASWAAKITGITAKIPPEHRDGAEQIITELAAAGGTLADLRHAAAVALAKTATADPDDDDQFEDRYLDAQATMDGAGTLRGSLTPECMAALLAVINALSGRCGKDDDRSAGARRHDALYQALLRLLGTALLPSKDGRPVTAIVHLTLADLIARAEEDGSPLAREWIAGQAARWARHLTGTSGGGDGGAWVSGATARGLACHAVLFPVVSGDPDLGKLDELVRCCVLLDQWRHAEPARFTPDRDAHRQVMADLARQVIGTCAEFLSGPGGLASFLRTNLLGDLGLAGPSLPLDAGDVDAIPFHIRKAVRARDITCAWPGGCDQPAWAAEPHHLVHRADHGHTSTTNLYCLCFFHHHVLLHRRGWTLRPLGDGTLEAASPDGQTTYRTRTRTRTRTRSRPPPPRPG